MNLQSGWGKASHGSDAGSIDERAGGEDHSAAGNVFRLAANVLPAAQGSEWDAKCDGFTSDRRSDQRLYGIFATDYAIGACGNGCASKDLDGVPRT